MMMTSKNQGKPTDNNKLPSIMLAFEKVAEGDGVSVVGFEKGSRKKNAVVLTAAYGTVAPPRCQVESCCVDLSNEKYYRRHKVCQLHAKSLVVTLAGKQQRFCQQCSRFVPPPQTFMLKSIFCNASMFLLKVLNLLSWSYKINRHPLGGCTVRVRNS